MLSESTIRELLKPYLEGKIEVQGTPGLHFDPFAAPPIGLQELVGRLSAYLQLLLRWNTKTNLTAIREPEEMVRRHFGESLFAGRVLASVSGLTGSVLDFGSGAGFPGIPIQLLISGYEMTLAESQGKKAAFLQEAVRTLGLRSSVWRGRVEDLPGPTRFDRVVMRAVDSPAAARIAARARVRAGGVLLEMIAGGPPAGGLVARLEGVSQVCVALERI